MYRKTNIKGVTVDTAGGRCHDDAIWVTRSESGGFFLTTSIADLSGLVPYGSPQDREAAAISAEATSNGYRTNRIFDANISRIEGNLLPGAVRDVVTIRTEFSADGELLRAKSYMGKLRSSAAFTNEEFDRILAEQAGKTAIGNMFRDATDLARALSRRNTRDVANFLYGTAFTKNGDIRGDVRPGDIGSTTVRELMIATNLAATKIVNEAGLPMIYRNTKITDGSIVLNFSTQHRGHVGLGGVAYGTFTSPIWRYVDTVNQRVLIAATRHQPSVYTVEALEKIARQENITRAAWLKWSLSSMANELWKDGSLAELDAMGVYDFSNHLRNLEYFSKPDMAAIFRRLEQSRLRYSDVAVILFSRAGGAKKTIQDFLLARVAATPNAAEHVMEKAINFLNRGKIETRLENVNGAWHAIVGLGGITAKSGGTSYEGARHWAFLRLLAKLANLQAPDLSVQDDDQASFFDTDIPDRLAELCQVMQWGDPSFNIISLPNNTFKGDVMVTSEIGVYVSKSVTNPCHAMTRIMAAKVALNDLVDYAATLITRKRRDGITWADAANDVTYRGPRMALKAFSYMYGFPMRTTWLKESYLAHEFICRIDFRGPNGPITVESRGTTRRVAETDACAMIIKTGVRQMKEEMAQAQAQEDTPQIGQIAYEERVSVDRAMAPAL